MSEQFFGVNRFEPRGELRPGGNNAAFPLGSKALLDDVRDLAVGFEDRVYQTERGREASAFLAKRMQEIGLKPVHGSYFQDIPLGQMRDEGMSSVKMKGPIKELPPPVPGRNVVGFIEGTDPNLKNEIVMVCAHHDSQPGTHQGANDNATGVAGVLAIAKMLVENPPKRSVLFITFDGEEIGRKGSRYYAAHPLFPIAKTALMVNMDMIGQVHLESGKRSEIYQWASGDKFATEVLETASRKTIKKGETAIAGYPEQPYEAQFFTTDAEPLYRLSVPTVNFLSGRDLDNHAPEDGMHRVIPERIAQYAKLAHQVAVEGANHPKPLAEVIGLEPGGLMPSFPLIAFRKEASTRSLHEERHRVFNIEAKLPMFRELSLDLVDRLPDLQLLENAKIDLKAIKGGEETLISEPALNRVRELHAELADQYHDIPKYDLENRREKQEQLEALSGLEGVLSAAIFLGKIRGRANDYQLKRVPEKVRELDEGAKKLGLGHVVEKLIDPEDIKDFTAVVSPERAIEIAYENAAHLIGAASEAVFAYIDPQFAAERQPRVERGDLKHVQPGTPLGNATEIVLELQQMAEYNGLKKGVRIADVSKTLGELRAELAKLPASDAVVKELDFWKDWLVAFEKVEPAAIQQVQARQAAVQVGWDALLGLWNDELKPKIAAKTPLTEQQLKFPQGARRELYYRALDAKKVEGGRDPIAELYDRLSQPFALAEESMRRIYGQASPDGVRELSKVVEELALQYPDKVGKLRECVTKLEKLRSKQEVQIGHGKGNTPVRVLDVRAAFEE